MSAIYIEKWLKQQVITALTTSSSQGNYNRETHTPHYSFIEEERSSDEIHNKTNST